MEEVYFKTKTPVMNQKIYSLSLICAFGTIFLFSCAASKKTADAVPQPTPPPPVVSKPEPVQKEPEDLNETFVSTYRESDIKKKDFRVSDPYVVDLKIDFGKIIRAQSDRGRNTVDEAKDEAYFKAITENDIHVLIDPVYQIRQSRGKFYAKVVGFCGYYSNPRPEKEEKAKEEKAEAESFDQIVKDLEKLSKIPEFGQEETKTFIMNTNGPVCCDGKNIGGDLGHLNLINTTVNKPSLVDQYLRLKNAQLKQAPEKKSESNLKEVKKSESKSSKSEESKPLLSKPLNKLHFREESDEAKPAEKKNEE
jgi:hypothetical protein